VLAWALRGPLEGGHSLDSREGLRERRDELEEAAESVCAISERLGNV